jgi:hypothetical protein
MKPSEIIAADAQANGLDPQEALFYVSDSVKNRGGTLVRKNNSVLLLTPIADNQAEWNLFTQDQGDNLVDSVQYFIDQVMKTDVIVVYGMVDNVEVLQTMSDLGMVIVESDNPEYQWMSRVK